MVELIVIDKIDGSPVAWRCSRCRQVFSIPGKLTMEERRRRVTVEFKAHIRKAHTTDEATVANTILSPGQPVQVNH